MKKKHLAILLPLIFGIVIFIYFTLSKWDREWKEIVGRCYTYDGDNDMFGTDIVDCYGYISIHHVDDHYSIKDLRYSPGIPIVVVHNLNQFKVIGDKMYTIDKNGITWYVKDNELRRLSSDDFGELPKYVIFHTQTGDTEFYSSFGEMPDDVKGIFEELSKYDSYEK